ncbi:MAG: hypothetical protein AB1921_12930 [Thermodesulfobacteriota bacterium]
MAEEKSILTTRFSSGVFAIITVVLYIVSFLLFVGIIKSHFEEEFTAGVFMIFPALYGAISGIVIGIFQQKKISAAAGIIAGPMGGIINWPGIIMASSWLFIYGAVELVIHIVKWEKPALADWLFIKNREMMDLAFGMRDFYSTVAIAGGILGVVLLLVYNRILFGKHRWINPLTVIIAMVVLAAPAVVLLFAGEELQKIIILLMSILFFGTFSVAPLLCLSDCFGYMANRKVKKQVAFS